jgi:hypothetical protein
MKRKIVSVLIVALFAAISVFAQEPVLQPRTVGGITYITGGIGVDERDALKKAEGDYTLRLLFAAQGSGELVADVKVTILDAKRKSILEVVSTGPRFFAKLAPGSYRIIAENNGTPIRRTVRISPKSPVSQAFYWKITPRDKPVE